MRRRIFSLLLALVMALSLTPVHLYAAEREPAAEPTDSDSGFSADYAGEYTLVTDGDEWKGYYTYARVLVAPGEFPTLQVQATSNDPDNLTYHWFSGTYYSAESGFEDSEEVWDATSDAYTVTDFTRHWYRCTVNDGYGNSRSLYFYAGVDNAFAVEPVGEKSVTVLPGQSVTLQVAVSATDLSRVTYQWYGGGNTISGADTDTLVMDAPMSGSYRCTVSDGYGNSGTIYFTVMVDSGFSADYAGEYTLVTVDYVDKNHYTYARVTAQPGEELTLQVQATSNNPDNLTYHWFSGTYYSSEMGFEDSEEIWSATSDAYTATDFTRHWYRCTVNDGYGNSEWLYFYVYVDNAFAVEPVGEKSVTVLPGQSVTLQVAVSATDLSRVTYQWYGRGNTISGADTDTLVMDAPMSGSYRCTVSDGYGNNRTIYYTVMVDSGFSADYAGEYTLVSAGSWEVGTSYTYAQVLVAPGEFPTLQVQATSNDPDNLTYHWFSGTYYSAESGFGDSEEVWDATSDAYTVTDLTRRWYRCTVNDGYGNSRSLYFYAGVDNAFAVEPVGETSVTVLPGQSVTLQVAVSAMDLSRVTYQWYDVDIGTAIGDAVSDTFTVESVTARKRYYCRVEDGYGSSQTVYFTVTVDNNLSVERVGEENVYVAPGESVTLQIRVTANDMEGLTYSWRYYNDYDGYIWIPDATSDSYTVENVTEGGYYCCFVTDKYSNVNSVGFYVNMDNAFSVEPVGETSVTVLSGQSLTLQVTASAMNLSRVTYRWYRNWNSISGADTDTLTLDTPMSGSYQCTVSDGYGSSQTVYFTVTVDNGFSVERVGDQNVYVPYGESATLQVRATANDTEGMTYTWYRNWNQVDGADGPSYTVENVTGRETCYCRVEDKYGSVEEIYFYVYVDNGFSVERVGEQNVYVPYGESATLQVRATANDTEGMTYTWYRNWNQVDGADGPSYTVENVTGRGTWYCRVEDKYGSVEAIYFYLYVDNGFSVEPQKEQSIYVSPGESAVLQVYVTANDWDGLTYQWYTWSDGQGWNQIEGATADAYTVESVTTVGRYYCYVTDKYGNSSEAWFRVGIQNHLNVQRVGDYRQYADMGGSVTLQVIATADDMEGITYRWRTWREGEGEYDIPGATTDTYTVENVTVSRYYFCYVTDKYGNQYQVEFHVCIQNHLSVERVGDYQHLVSPGESVTLQVRVTADDMEGLTYRWRTGGDGEGWYDISGATTDSFTVENVTAGKYYYCYVTDKYGTVQEVGFQVGIQNHLTVERVGDYQHLVSPGESVTLQVIASADDMEGLTYQWRRQSNNTPNNWYWVDIPGATSDTYTVENVTASEQYDCYVTDKYGTQMDAGFFVGIQNHLIVQSVGGYRHLVSPGESVTLQVIATADDMEGLTYRWYRETPGMRDSMPSERIDGATTDTYTVENVTAGKYYYCYVTDKYGNQSRANFFVGIENHLTVERVGESQRLVSPGESVTLQVIASADDMEGLTYQWLILRENYGYAYIDGAASDTYTVENVTAGQQYLCRVTDKYGTVQEVGFQVGVENHLTVERVGDHEQYVSPGGSVTLQVTVSADDMEGITYRWCTWIDGVGQYFIPGATTNTCTVENASASREYVCYVTDKYGTQQYVHFWVHIENHLQVNAVDGFWHFALSGGSVTLQAAVTADVTDGLTCQWYVRESADAWYELIPGATSDTVTVENVTGRCWYQCIVTDKYGNQSRAYFGVNIENHFTAEAVGETVITVPAGGSVTLAVTASADDMEGISYQWFAYKDGTGYENIDGAVSHAFIAENVREDTWYLCEVRDKYDTYYSIEFHVLAKTQDVAIIGQPEDVIAAPGETVTFTVTAAGDGLTYQWQVKTPKGTAWTNTSAAGSRTDTLEVSAVAVRNGYQYRCVVTDRYGGQAASRAAKLTVTSTAVITGQPEDYTGPIGTTASFTVTAKGTGLTYQWQYKSLKDGKWRDTKTDGYQTPTMRIGVTAARDGMEFRCKVKDAYGREAISDAAALHVFTPVTITSQPEDCTGPIGTAASFTVTAEGTGLTYQWQYKSRKDGKWYSAKAEGANSPTMSIEVTAARDGMEFRCRVRDAGGGEEFSGSAALYVAAPLTITGQPQDFTGPVGATASFTVTAEGDGLTYQWQYKSARDGKWYNAKAEGSNTMTMRIGVTAARDGMEFRCKVTDAYGIEALSDSAVLHMVAVLAITGQPQDFAGPVGATASFTVTAEGDGLTYQWQYRSSKDGKWYNAKVDGANTSTMRIGVTDARNGMKFRCKVTDAYGNQAISDAATLRVG